MAAPDLSAFWLYPDWDGPIKEPFWMRPPRVTLEAYDLAYASPVSFGPRVRLLTYDRHEDEDG